MSTTNSNDLTALDGGRGSGGRLREEAGGCQAATQGHFRTFRTPTDPPEPSDRTTSTSGASRGHRS
jgi:hypothetical protein